MKQKTLHKHFWDVTGLIFPFFCKLSLWKRTCTSSTLCHHKQLGSLDFISKATTQRTLDLSQPSNFHTCTRGQPSFKSATEEKICLHFHILTWGKERKKREKEKLEMFWDLRDSWVNREQKGCLPYTNLFFSFFFPHCLLPKPTRLKGKPRAPGSLPAPQHLPPARVGGGGGRAVPAPLSWHGSRRRGSGHSDDSIEPDRCLLTGPTIHLERAAWNCKVVYYDSLISLVQTVQCILFWGCECKWPKSELYGTIHITHN